MPKMILRYTTFDQTRLCQIDSCRSVGKKLDRELIVIKDFIKYSLIYLIVVANKVPGTGNMMNNKTKCTKALELVMPCRSKA